MKKTPVIMLVFAFALLFINGCQSKDKIKIDPSIKNQSSGLYALMETTLGKITIKLFEKEAPLTVNNFVGLANGEKEWLDPKSGNMIKKRFYDGLIFHRVIPNFMIQGGDPLGNGQGGPGYKLQDEFSSSLKFDQLGLLAMANSGPNTNGSQFFITTAYTPWLNNRYTIFGKVIEGMDVVLQISKVSRDKNDKPIDPIIINKVTIERID